MRVMSMLGVLFSIGTAYAEMIERPHPSLVHITVKNHTEDVISPDGCSGFFIENKQEQLILAGQLQLIATNIHCILEPYEYFMLFHDEGSSYPIVSARDIDQDFYPDLRVYGYHPTADIVVLSTHLPTAMPNIEVDTESFQQGDFGYSYRYDAIYAQDGLYPTVSKNNILHVTQSNNANDAMIYHNLEFILPGYSGGPLVDETSGELMGINFFGWMPYSNIAYHKSEFDKVIYFDTPITMEDFFRNHFDEDQIVNNDVFGYYIRNRYAFDIVSEYSALVYKREQQSQVRHHTDLILFDFITARFMFYVENFFENYSSDEDFDHEMFLYGLTEIKELLDDIYNQVQDYSYYPMIQNSIDCKYGHFYELFSHHLQLEIPETKADSCMAYHVDISNKQEALEKTTIDRTMEDFSFQEYFQTQKDRYN